MYEKHFGLNSSPFASNAQGDAVYDGPDLKPVIAGIQKGLGAQDAVVTVTGPVGVGKTTITTRALEQIHPGRMVAWVGRMQLSPDELFGLLLAGFGIDKNIRGTIRRIGAFRRYLHERAATGIPVAIVVEDTERLGAETLIELEALTAADSGMTSSANIVLMGEPNLYELLDTPKLARLKQRVRSRQSLASYSKDNVLGYMQHCIAQAGGRFEQIFDTDVADIVYQCSDGMPRAINSICDAALTAASDANLSRVTADHMTKIATDSFGYTAPPQPAAALTAVANAAESVNNTMPDDAATEQSEDPAVPVAENDEIEKPAVDTNVATNERRKLPIGHDIVVESGSYPVKSRTDDASDDNVVPALETTKENASIDQDVPSPKTDTNDDLLASSITEPVDDLGPSEDAAPISGQIRYSDEGEVAPEAVVDSGVSMIMPGIAAESLAVGVDAGSDQATEATEANTANTNSEATNDPINDAEEKFSADPSASMIMPAISPELLENAADASLESNVAKLEPSPTSKVPESKTVEPNSAAASDLISDAEAQFSADPGASIIMPGITPELLRANSDESVTSATAATEVDSDAEVPTLSDSMRVAVAEEDRQAMQAIADSYDPAWEEQLTAKITERADDDLPDLSELQETADEKSDVLPVLELAETGRHAVEQDEKPAPRTEEQESTPDYGGLELVHTSEVPAISATAAAVEETPAEVEPETDIDALEAALDAAKRDDVDALPELAAVPDADDIASIESGAASGVHNITLDAELPDDTAQRDELDKAAAEIGTASSLEDISDTMAETLFGNAELDSIAAAIVANPPEGHGEQGAIPADSESPVKLETPTMPDAANDPNDLALEKAPANSGPQTVAKAAKTPPTPTVTKPVTPVEAPATAKRPAAPGNDVPMNESVALRIDILNKMKNNAAKFAIEKVELGEAEPSPAPAGSTDQQPEPIESQIDTSITQTLKAVDIARMQAAEAEAEAKEKKKSGGLFSRFKRSS